MSVLRHAPWSRSRGGQPRHVRPARAPRDRGRCCYDFPAPSALQGCFLNLPTEAFDEAFSSSGLLTAEPCATVTTMPCPTPRPAVRRRRWRSTRPRTSSTSRRQRCASLPPDLCPSASLTGAMPRSGEASRAAEKAARGADRAAAEARAASARAGSGGGHRTGDVRSSRHIVGWPLVLEDGA